VGRPLRSLVAQTRNHWGFQPHEEKPLAINGAILFHTAILVQTFWAKRELLLPFYSMFTRLSSLLSGSATPRKVELLWSAWAWLPETPKWLLHRREGLYLYVYEYHSTIMFIAQCSGTRGWCSPILQSSFRPDEGLRRRQGSPGLSMSRWWGWYWGDVPLPSSGFWLGVSHKFV